ncbi:MAG: hypothetical protein L3K09_03475, partial [Thermoplasmata archaeon]|nr:hypothetical protein [Thermoplasmata archaeon]
VLISPTGPIAGIPGRERILGLSARSPEDTQLVGALYLPPGDRSSSAGLTLFSRSRRAGPHSSYPRPRPASRRSELSWES